MLSEKEQREKEIFREKVETIRKEVDLLESHRLIFESNKDEFLHITPKQYQESGRRIMQEVAELEREYGEEQEQNTINRCLKEIDETLNDIHRMLYSFSRTLDEDRYNFEIQNALDGIIEVANGHSD